MTLASQNLPSSTEIVHTDFFIDVYSSFQSSFFFVLRDEGVVLKDLGSKWEPGDRSGKWMKLKPEYVRAGSDLDVLIIGVHLICLCSLV